MSPMSHVTPTANQQLGHALARVVRTLYIYGSGGPKPPTNRGLPPPDTGKICYFQAKRVNIDDLFCSWKLGAPGFPPA
jgi:hypothetical protein